MLTTTVILLTSFVSGEVYFKETFPINWKKIWKHSTTGRVAEFVRTAGWWSVDPNDKGLQTQNVSFNFAISAAFAPFSMNSKPLVLQYTLRNQQIKKDCIGGYVKLLKHGFDAKTFSGETPYHIMFGPDMCNNILNQDLEIAQDRLTHQYTLVVNPDFSVIYLLDNKEIFRGSLKTDFGLESADEESYQIEDIGGIGIEILQQSPGSLFDNFLIADSIDDALQFSEETFSYLLKDEPEVFRVFNESQEGIRDKSSKEMERMEALFRQKGPGTHYF